MQHLKAGSLSPERMLRYYSLVEKVCAGNLDTAAKARQLLWEKHRERGPKREALGFPNGETVAETFLADILRAYQKYGSDRARALRSMKIMYPKAVKGVEVRTAFARQKQQTATRPPAPQPFNYEDKSPTEIVRHVERQLTDWQAFGSKLSGQEKAMFQIVLTNVAERLRAIKEQYGIGDIQPVLKASNKPAAPIEVVFKHPTDRGSNLNTAMVRDGQPVAQIRAGGSPADFWKGVFFTMEFSKEQQ